MTRQHVNMLPGGAGIDFPVICLEILSMKHLQKHSSFCNVAFPPSNVHLGPAYVAQPGMLLKDPLTATQHAQRRAEVSAVVGMSLDQQTRITTRTSNMTATNYFDGPLLIQCKQPCFLVVTGVMFYCYDDALYGYGRYVAPITAIAASTTSTTK